MANGSIERYVKAHRRANAKKQSGHGLRALRARIIETARLLVSVNSQLNELEETAAALWTHYASLNAELERREEGLLSLRTDMQRQDKE